MNITIDAGMAQKPTERPHIEDLPGAWPSTSANSFREQYLRPGDNAERPSFTTEGSSALLPLRETPSNTTPNSSEQTAVPSVASSDHGAVAGEPLAPTGHAAVSEDMARGEKNMEAGDFGPIRQSVMSEDSMVDEKKEETGSFGPARHSVMSVETPVEEKEEAIAGFEPIKTGAAKRPGFTSRASGRLTQEDISRVLSRRRTNATEASASEHDDMQEIERLMSRMFGQTRQAQSEDEKTRHVGVAFKNLTVKGMGLGAAIQPTVGDMFLGLPRTIKGLFSNPRRAAGKPPIRTLLNNFNGCIKPGEMLLVLGAPGSGCSTFLKVLANQRYGYESVDGDVTYGGTDAKIMAKDYRGEVLYNPEDDLHYATLSVKNTLSFALKTRTPGKASRNEGESRADYVREFLRAVVKLFWIEHTLGTKVGDEYVRGVSGGEKKRVSIAEAMITKASTQCWDNSTRGLDASTALEYVEALRSLTNMAQISTAVALYQAGESLYDLFDKVVLIHEGKCLYYGPTKEAAAYFEGLGFTRPSRWTTADFVSIPFKQQGSFMAQN